MADSHLVLNRIWPVLVVLGGVLTGACAPERLPPEDARLVWWRGDDARLVTARLGDRLAEELDLPVDEAGADVPESAADRTCQKCHALAAGRIAFTYFGLDGQGGVAVWDGGTSAGPALVSNAREERWNFASLHRGGEVLVTNAGRRLDLRDAATGAVQIADAAGREAAQPAFAAAADTLVFASDLGLEGGDASNELEFDESSLYLAELAGDRLSVPERVVDGAGQALAYPALSPDGRYLVYTRAPWSQSARGDELTPGQLELYDRVLGNTRPLLAAAPHGRAWMPSLFAAADGLWVAFVSREHGEPSLQVAALDPSRAGDPSSPAVPVAAAVGSTGLFPRFVPTP